MRRLILLPLILCACGGGLAPVKRTLTLAPGGSGYAVSLVFPGLHAHEAQKLLTEDATAHAERFSCPGGGPQASLTGASEETTPPPKDAPEGAEPKSSTKVEGTVVCQP